MVIAPGNEDGPRCVDDIEDLGVGDIERPRPRETVVPKVIRRGGPTIPRIEEFSGDSFIPGKPLLHSVFSSPLTLYS